MSDPLAWRFFRWMCEPSKLKIHAWHFFFWITPRWLSGKVQMYGVRCFAERYPDTMERKIREAMAPLGATRSEEQLAAMRKDFLDVLLHPPARKRRFSQSGPHP